MRVQLPAQFVESAREYADGTREPVEPRNAATVVLMRSGADGPEVYLLRRQTSMAFAGGMCVFPGGGVDPRDFDHPTGWAGPTPGEWATQLGTDEAHRAGAGLRRRPRDLRGVRRAAGWRVGRRQSSPTRPARTGRPTAPPSSGASWPSPSSSTDAAWCCGPTCSACGAAWLTPVFEPRRYRTWFFVADLPGGPAHARRLDRVRPGRPGCPRCRAVARRGGGAAADAAADLHDLPRRRSVRRPGRGARRRPGPVVEMFTPQVEEGDREAGTLSVPPRMRDRCWSRRMSDVTAWTGGAFGERAALRAGAQRQHDDPRRHQHLGAPRARVPAARWWSTRVRPTKPISTPSPNVAGEVGVVSAHPPPPRPLRGGQGVRRAGGLRRAGPGPGVPPGHRRASARATWSRSTVSRCRVVATPGTPRTRSRSCCRPSRQC